MLVDTAVTARCDMDRVLPCTLRPNRASELLALANEKHGGSIRAVVAKLLELSRKHCIRKCRESSCHESVVERRRQDGATLDLGILDAAVKDPTMPLEVAECDLVAMQWVPW
eukprot:Skav213035  [mRNA]  locus=scaffold844:134694:142389:+ [translate_table: standard]